MLPEDVMTFATIGQYNTPPSKSAPSLRSAALLAAGLIASATPAAAQTYASASNHTQPQTTLTSTIQWKLPVQADTRPGAITMDLTGDGNRVWFVTRVGGPVKVYRLDLRGGKRVNQAKWFAWNLDEASITSGGLKRIKASKDQRFIYVRTPDGIVRVDTGSCKAPTLTYSMTTSAITCDGQTWIVPEAFDIAATSDLAVDVYNNVFAAFSAGPELEPSATDTQTSVGRSFIQRVNPAQSQYNVTRWFVGGGAGHCGVTVAAQESSPCLSGVTLHPRNPNLVYYSEPTGGFNKDGTPNSNGAIGELDTVKKVVRRWSLSDVSDAENQVMDPRQLLFDKDDRVWVVTGSGHLVSLDPKNNRMSRHTLPDGALNDLFGAAPDGGGVVGYTAASLDANKVGMLIPKRNEVPAYPKTNPVLAVSLTVTPDPFPAVQTDGDATPIVKTVPVRPGTTPEGSTVREALMELASPGPSLNPLGIIPDEHAAVGTFFYAIGQASEGVNIIGRIRLRKDVHARFERDDDDIDDDGKRADEDDDVDEDGIKNSMDGDNDNDGTPDISDDDDDDDGIEDDWDTKDKKEFRQSNEEPVAAGQYSQDTFTVTPGTLLVVAAATSTDPTAPMSVEILNAAGQIVGSALSTPGGSVLTFIPSSSGGTFTLRVKNQSVRTSTISTKILTRELWPVLPSGGL